jgi:penicillin amidase
LVPFEEMPRLLNPPRDYVATANNPVIDPDDAPFLSGDSDFGYRAARIEELIESMDAGYAVSSAQDMQMDNRDGGAPNLVPHLLAVESSQPEVAEIQEMLDRWATGPTAFHSAPDSPGAAAYQATWVHLLRLAFHDELPEESWPEGGSRWFEVIRALLASPDDPWWDDVTTDDVEGRDAILERAMADAHAELTEILGADPTHWKWSQIHTASFENQTLGQSGIGPIEWLFNRSAPERLGGGADIVNAVGFFPPDGYVVDWIPSMRMVIDLSDLAASTAGNTTGQSGHAFHPHYDDQLDAWAVGDQHPLRWAREQVLADATATLMLRPGLGSG